MTRNLKALGLALVAVFAIGALAAAAASAQNGMLTADGPMTLKGTLTGEELANATTMFGQKTTCPEAIYTAHKYNITPHEKILSGETTITVTPHYGICKLPGTLFKTTVDMNGCDYVLHLTKTTGVADQYAITTTIVCPTGKHIVMTLFTNEEFHKVKKESFCHITLTEAASYDGLVATDTTNGSIDITGTIENIEADKEFIVGTDTHKGILCPKETTKTGILHVDMNVKDTNGTSIGISDQEEPEPEGPEKFTSDGPMTLKGTLTGAELENSLTAFGQKITCPEAIYTGHKYNATPHQSIPSGATTVTITPHYGICKIGAIIKMTVDMNGCDYVFDLEGTTENEDEYFLKTTIRCPENQHVTLTLFTNEEFHKTKKESFCHITITENAAGYSGLKAKDTTNDSIDITGTIENLEADKGFIVGTDTDKGILCPTEETKTGILHVDMNVKDTNGTSIGISDQEEPEGPEKFTSDGPMTLKGTLTGAELENSLTAFGQKITCPEAIYTGHKYNATPHQSIPSGATTVTITPHYGICKIGAIIKMTVDMNGCDYVFDLEGTTENEDEYFLKTTIRCPENQHVTLTLFTNEEFHKTKKESFCHITITENAAGYSGLKAKDTTNDSIDITGTIENLEADKGFIVGTDTDKGILCPTEETKTGILHVDMNVKDTNGTSIGISHT
jgi:hypothetical protein